MIIELMIQPEGVAPVEAGQQSILTRKRVPLSHSRNRAERHAIHHLQLHIREPQTFARLEATST